MSNPDLVHSLSSDAEQASVSAEEFKRAFRHHPGGVALITANPGTRLVALTATSVISVSAEPPVLVFSLSEHSTSTPLIRESTTVVVHLLGSDRKDLAILGATSETDRFDDTSLWTMLPTGEPLFLGVPNWIRAEITDQVHVGGSTVIVATSIETSQDEPAESPLVYVNRTWHRLGMHSEI